MAQQVVVREAQRPAGFAQHGVDAGAIRGRQLPGVAQELVRDGRCRERGGPVTTHGEAHHRLVHADHVARLVRHGFERFGQGLTAGDVLRRLGCALQHPGEFLQFAFAFQQRAFGVLAGADVTLDRDPVGIAALFARHRDDIDLHP